MPAGQESQQDLDEDLVLADDNAADLADDGLDARDRIRLVHGLVFLFL